MTRTRRVLASAVVAPLLVLSTPALADEVGAIGWWTRSPSQEAPEGGFAVGAAPDGPVSVAAASVDLGTDGVERASLRAVETGGLGQAAARLQVCPTDELWQPVAGGSMVDAPTPDCDRAAAPFERNEATATWQADVTALVQDRTGSMGLMVVPVREEVGSAMLFEVRFAAPSFDAVEAPPSEPGDEEATSRASGAPPSPRAVGPDPAPAPADAEDGTTTAALTPSPPREVASADTDEPAASPMPPATASEAPDTPGTRLVGDGPSTGQDALVAAPAVRATGTEAEGSRWGQALLFVALSAAVATATALTRRWLRLR